MRYVLAIASLVLAGVMLLLGIGQRSFLAGPSEIVHQIQASNTVSYGVIAAEELDKVTGAASVRVSSEGEPIVLATGSTIDIEAWVAPFDHERFTVAADGKSLRGKVVPAVVPEQPEVAEGETAPPAPAPMTPLDPRGSDLWVDQLEGESNLNAPLALNEGESVLVASTGVDPQPTSFSLAWQQDRSTPLAGPFLLAGAAFALLGAVMYLIAIDHDRRGVGPRRGNRGPLAGIRGSLKRTGPVQPMVPERSAPDTAEAGDDRTTSEETGPAAHPEDVQSAGDSQPDSANPGDTGKTERRSHSRGRRTLGLGVLGLGFTLAVTGCSSDYWPQIPAATESQAPTEESEQKTAPVPVTNQQIDRILANVSEVAATADLAKDAEALKTRFTGPALAQRTANYKIRSSVDTVAAPPAITDQRLDYELIQSTEGWPRTLFITVGSAVEPVDPTATPAPTESATPAEGETPEPAASPSLALVLTQENPQQNYLVQSVIEVRGGIEMPAAAAASEGTARLGKDVKTLRLAPGQVAATFAEILQKGTSVPGAEAFDLADDELVANTGLAWATSSQAAADKEKQLVKHTVEDTPNPAEVLALSTGEGGALVMATIDERRIGRSTNDKPLLKANEMVTAFSGIKDSQLALFFQVEHQMLFFVPNADSDQKIRVLGSTTQMTGAGSIE